MKALRRGVAALLLTLGLGGGIVALTGGQAHATYQWFWGGLNMTDTENHCNLNDTNPNTYDCYTWVQANGNVRRGSPTEYFNEAAGGFVYALCSSAVAHTAPAPDIYARDFWGSTVNKHFHWVFYPWAPGTTEYSVCHNPVSGAGGYPWQGTSWSILPNGAPL